MAPALIERRTERSCDRLGRSWQHVVLSRHVTPAEFDAARACIPAAVDLQRAAEDECCGAELLEGMERDMAVRGSAGSPRSGRASSMPRSRARWLARTFARVASGLPGWSDPATSKFCAKAI